MLFRRLRRRRARSKTHGLDGRPQSGSKRRPRRPWRALPPSWGKPTYTGSSPAQLGKASNSMGKVTNWPIVMLTTTYDATGKRVSGGRPCRPALRARFWTWLQLTAPKTRSARIVTWRSNKPIRNATGTPSNKSQIGLTLVAATDAAAAPSTVRMTGATPVMTAGADVCGRSAAPHPVQVFPTGHVSSSTYGGA